MYRMFLLPILFLLTSCDCVQHATGVVLDKTTGHPLDSVQYRHFERGDKQHPFASLQYTNTEGRFEVNSMTGGLGDCKLYMEFSRDGYTTMDVTYPPDSKNDTVYLERDVFGGPGFDIKDTITFNQLQQYILRNGTVDSANASSRIDKPWYVVYHTVCIKGLCLSIDHSDRIYFNREDKTQEHVGNLLKEDGRVVIEDADAAGKKEITAAAKALWERVIRSK